MKLVFLYIVVPFSVGSCVVNAVATHKTNESTEQWYIPCNN